MHMEDDHKTFILGAPHQVPPSLIPDLVEWLMDSFPVNPSLGRDNSIVNGDTLFAALHAFNERETP